MNVVGLSWKPQIQQANIVFVSVLWLGRDWKASNSSVTGANDPDLEAMGLA